MAVSIQLVHSCDLSLGGNIFEAWLQINRALSLKSSLPCKMLDLTKELHHRLIDGVCCIVSLS